MSTTISLIDDGRRAGDFIEGESNFWRSRDHVLITGDAPLAVGTVVASLVNPNAAGLMVVSASPTNVGNGVLTPAATPVLSTAVPGTYTATLVTEGANAGTFEVRNPSGVVVGNATVAVAFSNQIAFTIADGSEDFDVGDSFSLTVNREDGLFAALDIAGGGAGATARGVLFDRVDPTNGPVRAVVLSRDFEANEKLLVWPEGITATEKATAYTQLLSAGVVVRTR